MTGFSEEAGKGAGQAIINAGQDVCGGMGRILGPAANNLSTIFDETTRYWRIKNALNIHEKIQKLCKERGYTPEQLKALSTGDSIRTIEAASYEEDESVQELWARLITNAISPDGKETVKKVYVEILRAISAPEAALLELLWACEQKTHFRTPQEITVFNKDMNAIAETKWRKFTVDVQAVAIQNLTRIRCITFRPRHFNASGLLVALPNNNAPFSKQFAAIEPQKFQALIGEILELVFGAAGVKEYASKGSIQLGNGGMLGYHSQITVPEMNYIFTALGKELMKACEMKVTKNKKKTSTELA